MKTLYKVGIYCRLSVDDASNSAKAKNYIPADESATMMNSVYPTPSRKSVGCAAEYRNWRS